MVPDLISTWTQTTSDPAASRWVASALLAAFPEGKVPPELPHASALDPFFPQLRVLASSTEDRSFDLAGLRSREPLLALAVIVAELGFVRTADWEARRLLFRAVVELLAYEPRLAGNRYLLQVASAIRIEIEALSANPTCRPTIPPFRSVWETVDWFGEQGSRYTPAAARVWKNHLRRHLRAALGGKPAITPWPTTVALEDYSGMSVIPSIASVDTEIRDSHGEVDEPLGYWLFDDDASSAQSSNSTTISAAAIGATRSTYVPLRRFSEASPTYLTDGQAVDEASGALAMAANANDANERQSALARALSLATATPIASLQWLRWGNPESNDATPFPGVLALDGRWLYRSQLRLVDVEGDRQPYVALPIPPSLAKELVAACGPATVDAPVFRSLAIFSPSDGSATTQTTASSTQLQRALLCRLMKQSRFGPSAAQLVAGDDLGIDLAPLHYDQIKALDLALLVAQVTFPWFADRPALLGTHVPNHLLGSVRVPSATVIAHMLAHFRDQWASCPQLLPDRIRHRTRNLIHGLCLTTGHRPFNSFQLITRADIGVDDAIGLLSDKVAGADWASRPVALATKWVAEYRALLSDLALAAADSEAGNLAKACRVALAGEGPVFLAMSTDGQVRSFDRAAYLEGVPEELQRVPNFARHFLNSELAKVLREPLRVGQMGWHGTREGAFADGSPWSVMTGVQEISPVLDRLLKTVGWRPLDATSAPQEQPRPARSWRRTELIHERRFRTLRSASRAASRQRCDEIKQHLKTELSHLLIPTGFGAEIGLHYADGELTANTPRKDPVAVPSTWAESLIRVLGGDPRSPQSHAARGLVRELLISGRQRNVLTGPLPRASVERWPSRAGAFMQGSADAIGYAREWDTIIARAPVSVALKTLSTLLLHGPYADLDTVVAAMHPGAARSTLASAPGIVLIEPPDTSAQEDEAPDRRGSQGTLAFHSLAAVALDHWHRGRPHPLDLHDLDTELQAALAAQLKLGRRRKPLAALAELASLARVANTLRMDGIARLIGTGVAQLTSAPLGRVVALLDDRPMGPRSALLARPPPRIGSQGEAHRAHRVHDLLRQLKDALAKAVEKRNHDRRQERSARLALVGQIRQWLATATRFRAEEVIAHFALSLLTEGGRRRPHLELSTIRGYVGEVSAPLARWLPFEPLSADADAWTQAYLQSVAEVPVGQRPARAKAIANFHWVLAQSMGIPDADLGAVFALAGRSTARADAGFLTHAELAGLRYVLMQGRLTAQALADDADSVSNARAVEWLTQVMFAGALRPGEACRLLFNQLPQSGDGWLRVERSRYQRLKNANARRRVRWLGEPVCDLLSDSAAFPADRAVALGYQFHSGLPVLGTRDDAATCQAEDAHLVPLTGLLRWVSGEPDARPYWLRKTGIQKRFSSLMRATPRSLWQTRDLLVEIGHADIRTTLEAYIHDGVTPFLRWFQSHWVALDVQRIQHATGKSRSSISRRGGGARIRSVLGSSTQRLAQLLPSPHEDAFTEQAAIQFPATSSGSGELRLEDLVAILTKIAKAIPLEQATRQQEWSDLLTLRLKTALMALEEWGVVVDPSGSDRRRAIRPPRPLAQSAELRRATFERVSRDSLRVLFNHWSRGSAFDTKPNEVRCSERQWESILSGLGAIKGLVWNVTAKPGHYISASLIQCKGASARHAWQTLLWGGLCAHLLHEISAHTASCVAQLDPIASARP